MRLLLVLVAAPLVAALAGPAGLVAQEATPAASPEATPAASPVAEACPPAPRSAEELLALWYDPAGTPVAAPVDASPAATPAALPGGEPADPDTVAAIDAAVQDWATCYNAGDVLGTLALLSDDLVRRQGPQGSATREDTRAALEAPPIPPAEPLVVGEALDARVLDDGRVGAVFAFGDPQQPAALVFIVFVEADGNWLLDDIRDAQPGSGPPAEATPLA